MPRTSAELIVVGSGSSGAAVAARATERSEREVLLLEAGPDYPPGVPLPADLADGTKNSWLPHDWHYKHLPTPTARMLFTFPRGRVVGGSSAVNTCIALRGFAYDYDEWAARGLRDWSFERCLPAFVALEDDRDFGDRPYHGKGGPIPIRRHPPKELVPWQAAFVEAAKHLGFPSFDDANDPNTKGGVGPHAMNKIDGKRQSAAMGYLTAETRARKNFELRADSLVRRVLFDERKRVRGVEIERAGRVETILAKKVALAGGAIATPGILLRSGVGPRDRVERMGVTPVADVPAVGARLLDHPGAALILIGRPKIASINQPLIQTVLRYTSKGSPFPNDMMVQPGSMLPIHPRLTLPMPTLMCCVGKPKGWGTIEYKTASASERPEMHSQMLVDREDHARAVEALSLLRDLAMTPPMRSLARFFWPGPRVVRDFTKLGEWIYTVCGSGYHPCGTAPMGADDDPDAATDGRGRVRGVEGLFVVDASLFPTVPSANTNLTALMMGERFGAWFRDGEL